MSKTNKLYKAEYEDDEFEIFAYCSSDSEAIKEAFSFEDEHGILFELDEINEDYDVIRRVF